MSAVDFGRPQWEVKTMTGYRINSPYIVTDPACPEGRHPTRDCGCRVFKTKKAAQAYADQKMEEQ